MNNDLKVFLYVGPYLIKRVVLILFMWPLLTWHYFVDNMLSS